jgi:hypothetical protein
VLQGESKWTWRVRGCGQVRSADSAAFRMAGPNTCPVHALACSYSACAALSEPEASGYAATWDVPILEERGTIARKRRTPEQLIKKRRAIFTPHLRNTRRTGRVQGVWLRRMSLLKTPSGRGTSRESGQKSRSGQGNAQYREG